MSESAPQAPAAPRPPLWRRALAGLAYALREVVVWLFKTLKAGAIVVWTRVRDKEAPASKRVAWAAGGVAGMGAVFGVFAVLTLLLYALVLWPFTPSVSDLRNAREVHPAVVVSADGEELTRYARRNRQWRALDEISSHVVDALIATEDRRFYRHGGMDFRRTAGALVYTALGDRQGGSTLTQQLARNLFPEEVGTDASVTRKLREAITAFKIERVYTKDEILELYLNTVPFLYNAWGIEMAARTYYSTSADELTPLQAATLVGMLKGTSSYNPKRNPERALARRNVVLQGLVVTGEMTEAEVAALRDEPLGLRFERQPMQQSRAPHFTEHVRVWLENWADRTGHSLYGDGLTVHTTLDWRMQQRADESARRFGDALQAVADVEWGRASADRLGPTTAPYVTASRTTEPFERFWTLRPEAADAFIAETEAYAHAVRQGRDADAVLDSLRGAPAFLDSLRQRKMRLEIGLTAVDPETGHVKVWVGSRDFGASAYDHVARARRQPGSTFKPFLYARALEEGLRPDDAVLDEVVSIEMPDGTVWQPTNASGTSTGELTTLRDGLAYSKNTVAAQLVHRVGARDVARTARRMGIRSDLEAVPSIALGTSEVSLLEMTSAYATIASVGVYRPPVWVTHITDRDGNEVARFEPASSTALGDDVALDLLDMMRGVVDRGTGTDVRSRFGARGDLAGKTGTTQDGADGWFLLMHPDLVTGAWVGFDDPRVTFRSSYWGQGGHNALRVVGDFHRSAQRAGLVDVNETFPRPPEREPEGPALWDRFAGWVGGLVDQVRDDGSGDDHRDSEDAADEPRPRQNRRVRSDDPRGREVFAENVEWLEDAWAELDRIEDPRLRAAAREALRQAAHEVDRRGWSEGWADRARAARDRAVAEAAREIERTARREAERRGFFVDEEAGERFDIAPLEEAPVTPAPPPDPTPRAPDTARAGEGGRIGW